MQVGWAAVLGKFKEGLLTGNASGVAVAGSSGSTAIAQFQDGLAGGYHARLCHCGQAVERLRFSVSHFKLRGVAQLG